MKQSEHLPAVWLLQDGEPLPIDSGARLMRTGDLATRLVRAGHPVIWWTSRFNHNLKRAREFSGTWCQVEPGFTIALLDGPPYAGNMSWRRIRHYRSIASHFAKLAEELPRPALVLGSLPSPELCEAGQRYAGAHAVPFVMDIRDPWPDIFMDYLPKALAWTAVPVNLYYRRKIRAIARGADSIVAVSSAMLDWGIRYSGREKTCLDRVLHIGFRRQRLERTISVPRQFTAHQPLVCLFATTCGMSYDGEMLIDAARRLEADGDQRIRIVIIGDGVMRSRWMARARGLSSVQFTGWISDEQLEANFHSAHLGLVLMKGGITRFWLGNKIFEYMSTSLGIVNNVPGEAAEITASDNMGINIERGDTSSLAAALRALAGDPARVRGYMENAKRAFAMRYDRDVVQASFVNHLRELIKRDQHRVSVAREPGEREPVTRAAHS